MNPKAECCEKFRRKPKACKRCPLKKKLRKKLKKLKRLKRAA